MCLLYWVLSVNSHPLKMHSPARHWNWSAPQPASSTASSTASSSDLGTQAGMSQSSYSPAPVRHQGAVSESGLRHLLLFWTPPSLQRTESGMTTLYFRATSVVVVHQTIPRREESPRADSCHPQWSYWPPPGSSPQCPAQLINILLLDKEVFSTSIQPMSCCLFSQMKPSSAEKSSRFQK